MTFRMLLQEIQKMSASQLDETVYVIDPYDGSEMAIVDVVTADNHPETSYKLIMEA